MAGHRRDFEHVLRIVYRRKNGRGNDLGVGWGSTQDR